MDQVIYSSGTPGLDDFKNRTLERLLALGGKIVVLMPPQTESQPPPEYIRHHRERHPGVEVTRYRAYVLGDDVDSTKQIQTAKALDVGLISEEADAQRYRERLREQAYTEIGHMLMQQAFGEAGSVTPSAASK